LILVFGHSGQVATELRLQGADLCLNRAQANFEVYGALAAAIGAHKPSAVINAVAYTAVDLAEEEPERAFQINAKAVEELAQACEIANIPLIHLSTDYVFDGSGDEPWQVSDPAAPINVYGRSKLAGENAVRSAKGIYAVLRTSGVVSAHGTNFLRTMLKLGAERDVLSVVCDQIGAPTAAHDIAAACLKIAGQLKVDPTKSGTYHYQSMPYASWAEVAREVFSRASFNCKVTDIYSNEYPTVARRPLNSRLDCSDTREQFKLEIPDWRNGVQEILSQLR
jgi:dTDP-4-dehydrorhamnose reductase